MEPLAFREDILPPLLALVLSVAAHLAAAWWFPGPGAPDRREPEAVLVEMRELPAEPAPARDRRPRPPARPRRRPKAEPKPERTPKPPPKPEPAPHEAPPPPATPSPAPRPEEAPPAPRPGTVAEAAPAPEAEPRPAPPPLAALLPRSQDLAAAVREPPDPTAGAEEVTLQLGAADPRYRGYLDRVQAAIDVSWRWKEALLAAGRPGSVTVGFTITADGRAEEIEITRSSGSPVLDDEAAEAVRRAVFPEFPRHWSIRRLRLFAQFEYRLE
ncbi:energy transducer TonB [Deferrisoma palaeochoriense]